MKLKLFPKLLLFGVTVFGLAYGYKSLVSSGHIPRPSVLKTLIPLKSDEITAEVLSNPANVKAVAVPTGGPVTQCMDGNTKNCVNGPVQEFEIWAWNAHMGFLFANGGPTTTKDSIMAKHGVIVSVKRQDDTNQMQTDLLDTATRLKSDPNAAGVKFITIMGDGSAAFFAAINPKLAKLGPEYQTEVIGSFGYSRGEDSFWGPAILKTNPEKARGMLFIGVLRDGDWNIAMKWAAQNNIPNNPDDTVYDPNAINWANSDSYTKAVETYINGYCVDMPVKGAFGGKKQNVCASGVVTWTPGDVTLAKKKGGVVPILTTKQSIFQMPCVIVGIKKYNKAHRTEIQQMLAAAFEGADQIKTNPAALQRGGEISQEVYQEKGASPSYWVKYYRGVTEPDVTGVMVPLGGSTVSNLADNLQLFGLRPGSGNIFDATYNTFGKIVVQQYPKLVPSYPPTSEILDTSFVAGVQAMNILPINNAEEFKYTSAPMKDIAGKRDYKIQFASGSAQILPESLPTLEQIYRDQLVDHYIIAIHGHTDNAVFKGLSPQQSEAKNLELSGLRAQAVKVYLQRKSPELFPDTRVRPYPHGQDEPIADNNTASGRDANRRVQIVLGAQ